MLEVPDQNLVLHTDVMVSIPMRKGMAHKKPFSIPINDFGKKINLFAIGGDAIKEAEELFND